ncbi:GNAT family N-acetyltransferase [Methylobacterium nodulans]|uniref:GCN5-related N-acetyltransferase n=1 Tax=Methylobacterium nodulans (strain LMG 21967 / CNCM I-2342 / ORS 2060) TaxID=460265 RepID=B8IGY7_METNO|nr:GNAT family N-acetyltransferase [Methylobacterium nodulans]ACL57862.1 GCN5-related N-acetyltransferase [Methylobacterium nodulans ORS 2060]
MQTGGIELRGFAPEHLDGAVALSRAAGWPHRREDWTLVLSLSVGTVLLDRSRVVGTAMTTPLGREAATINMVIVDEAMRGHGLGRRLMDAALAAADGRACRLIATEAGLPLYERLGFRATGRIVQHQGPAVPGAAARAEGVAWSEAPPVADLAALDREACGMDRAALIGRLAAEGRIAVLRRDGAIRGFAALRAFGRGEVIGPVVAGNPEEARALLAFVMAARRGAFLRVDTPEEAGLAPWLAAQGLVAVGGGIAMQRGGAHPQPAGNARTFALASQALG